MQPKSCCKGFVSCNVIQADTLTAAAPGCVLLLQIFGVTLFNLGVILCVQTTGCIAEEEGAEGGWN